MSVLGLGDAIACTHTLESLRASIDGINSKRHCIHYWIAVMHNDLDLKNELLEPQEVDKLTQGVYPSVWCNLTYDLDFVSNDVLRRLEDEFHLRLLNAGIAKTDDPF